MESVGEGVPMLCWPCFWDQKVNARYVSHVWKVGVELESVLERGEVERVIKLLTVDEEGAEIRKKAKELKESTERAGREGGSSFIALNSLNELIRSM
ncbi:UDP-glucose iridoid glucosyltransferase-like protein [Cinnamomum micranthum f. kanehirae]|uniref:UDP-glucose iridoid glucosyltransferase-like protein n=1 Tax=Cinnamomum micranthum f. kanehirae TaxID=337451 RepID=A0A443PMT9_9MAGN|nr:UDP-glucose iridoid glucosyltransferase-like protein [Cinnamomum micranthum f. kanehirae]